MLRSAVAERYRFGYQGQYSEYDPETETNHFELRDYDPVVGRWFGPDPYQEFYSSYVGMGNNPVSMTDPNGGSTDDCPGCPKGAAVGTIYLHDNDGLQYVMTNKGWDNGHYVSGSEVFVSPQNFVPNVDPFSGYKGFANNAYSPSQLPIFQHKLWGQNIIATDVFKGSSFTPGNFVVSGTSNYQDLNLDNTHVQDHYRHEFGHIDQYKSLGIINYYSKIVIPSVRSFHNHPEAHDDYFTERSANLFGALKYGEFNNPKLYPKLDYDGPMEFLHR